MGLFTQFRLWFARKLIVTPDMPEDRLSTRGVTEYALDTAVKRDIIRELAYHLGTRRRYSPDNGSVSLDVIAEYAIYDDSFPVSTDMTDYDSEEEFYSVVQDAKREHIVECMRDLVDANIIEVLDTTDNTFSAELSAVDSEDIGGVRPGVRFEHAVQVLLMIDSTTDSLNRWDSSI